MKTAGEIKATAKGAVRAAKKAVTATVKKRTRADTDHMKAFVDDVESLVKHVATVSDAEVARIRAKVEGALEGAREALEERAHTINERARAGADAADEFVHRSPWTAVGVAVALGALLGLAARPRR